MASVVYLHVGAPKTGTTYLQDRLYLNRAELASHYVHYPVGLNPDMFGAALDLIDLPWGGQREGVRGEWDNLMGRVRRSTGTVILSHEILAGARAEQVAQAMRDLAEFEVHLVYSSRDIVRQLPAEWQETLKHRSRKSFKRFLQQAQAADRRDPTLWFWRAQSLPDVLNRWSAGLPPDRVHLVTVPQAGAPRDELWIRFCSVFGFDPALAPADSDRVNQSIGVDEAFMLRRLNRKLKRVGLDSTHYRAIVRQLIVHETLAHRPNMARVTFPPTSMPWAEEIAEEWIEWVEGSGINVVGDVTELRPAPVEADARWINPDKARRGKVGDVAMEALVAVIVETAERPDPDRAAAARLGRAARRLRGQ